jgi:hypothetical protein
VSLIHHAAILVADLDRAERVYGELFVWDPDGYPVEVTQEP